ncbi:NnrS family protein [Hydrogenophilus thermoluteolus]|uniref:NnrS family protein n=1 Tax=Hydrogenophilus thermoluteolus TaxID=297 RepID=UPI001C640DD1|nr:NnrS family protein [Hydrogenophilus thermoluteolus]MBW7657510.1 NnrS family protein [Hydrogenophilus thermoluteolus]HNQ49552.1 NnrS family protein [Hydrogenophilus thermoluteolus]
MKTADLRIEAAPAYRMPMGWFALAPFFLVLAGVLLLSEGPELFLSRWHPAALALTHLFALGFMGSVMVGALMQVIPVLSGQSWPQRWRRSRWPRAAFAGGVLALAAHFLWSGSLSVAHALAGVALALLLAALAPVAFLTLWLLLRIPSLSDSIRDLRWVAAGLGLTVTLGALLLLQRIAPDHFAFDHLQWVTLHLSAAWGLWGLALVATVGFVVVPMFQLTPVYPPTTRRRFTTALWGAALITFIFSVIHPEKTPLWVVLGVGWLAWAFAAQTLALQDRSKRKKRETTGHLWRGAMIALCLAVAMAFASATLPEFSPFLVGIMVFWGGFAGVICAMWIKIIPFLTWLNIQQMPNRKGFPPTMLKITPEKEGERLRWLWLATLLLLFAAVFLPEPMSRVAGIAVIATAVQLARILWHAWQLFNEWERKHLDPTESAQIATS